MSADKMMVKAKGPVWRQKHKKTRHNSKRFEGYGQTLATWGKSKAKGWIYGHRTFTLTFYKIPILGIFQWIKI
jgi:hypothetical protein